MNQNNSHHHGRIHMIVMFIALLAIVMLPLFKVSESWLLVIALLLMVGMHIFGGGHGMAHPKAITHEKKQERVPIKR